MTDPMLSLLRKVERGKVRRDADGFILDRYPLVDEGIDAEVQAAVAAGFVHIPELPVGIPYPTATVGLSEAGRAKLWLAAREETAKEKAK